MKRASGSGGSSAVEPPVPIPNTEVKHRCADGSVAIGHVRVGRRQVIRKNRFRKEPAFCVWGPMIVEVGASTHLKMNNYQSIA